MLLPKRRPWFLRPWRLVLLFAVLSVVGAASLVTNPPEAPPPDPRCLGSARCFSGTVERVVDGDTMDIAGTRIRLALVDTPEVGEPGHAEAKVFTEAICRLGSQALVDEDDGQTEESFDRLIAVVMCGDRNLNAELLASGHGVLAASFCPVSEFAAEPWTGCP